MARSIDLDYIDLSLHGFDIGINFDVFEENMKRIMELPIKYLDSAHGKAVELIEDVHGILWDTFPDGEVPIELHDTFKDASNSSVSGSLPVSVETKLVGANDELSNRASPISVENGFTDSIDMDAHETQSDLTKNPESSSSKWDHINANGLCLLPKDTLTTEVYDNTTSEEIILWNPENSAKRPQLPEATTISEDECVPRTLDTEVMIQQVGLNCSAYSDIVLGNSGANYEEHTVLHSVEDPVEAGAHETVSRDSSADISKCADDSTMNPDDTTEFVSIDLRNGPEKMKYDKVGAETVSHDPSADISKCADDNSTMSPDDTTKFVSIDLRNGQENMKYDKVGASYVPVQQNPSFKKMLMRKLTSRIWWSKNQASVQQQVVPDRSEQREDLGFQLVSSSVDDLDDEWEVL